MTRQRNLTAQILTQYPDDTEPWVAGTRGALGVTDILQRSAALIEEGATVTIRVVETDTVYTPEEYARIPWIVDALATGDAI